jgi:hypothetical protein
MGAPSILPAELSALLTAFPAARVVDWLRAEDYASHERLIAYVVQLSSEEERASLAKRLDESGTYELHAPDSIIVYLPD